MNADQRRWRTDHLEGARKWLVVAGIYGIGLLFGALAEGLVDWNALLRL